MPFPWSSPVPAPHHNTTAPTASASPTAAGAPCTVAPPYTAFMPRIRKSPFFNATRRWGCNAYSVYNHTYIPLYYADAVTDYWSLIRDASLWDVAGQRQVEVRGRDAARFAQYLTPRNLSGMQSGQCKYVFLCDENGGIVNDPVLLKLSDTHFWLSLADSDVLLWAKGVALHAGMDVTLCEPEVSPLQIQGPRSPEVMTAMFGEWVGALKYYRFQQTEWHGVPVVVSRTGWSSERGYEVFLRDCRHGEWLWEAIMKAGQPFGIAPGAPSMIRRIEGGMLSHGADTGLHTNPFEMGMERLVDLEQEADFIGKEALRRIRDEGVRRRFVGLTVHGRDGTEGAPLAANEHPWSVRGAGDKEDGPVLGTMTSMVHSPRLQKNIALALLANEHSEVGTELRVAGDDAEYAAVVTALPFYDKGKKLASG